MKPNILSVSPNSSLKKPQAEGASGGKSGASLFAPMLSKAMDNPGFLGEDGVDFPMLAENTKLRLAPGLGGSAGNAEARAHAGAKAKGMVLRKEGKSKSEDLNLKALDSEESSLLMPLVGEQANSSKHFMPVETRKAQTQIANGSFETAASQQNGSAVQNLSKVNDNSKAPQAKKHKNMGEAEVFGNQKRGDAHVREALAETSHRRSLATIALNNQAKSGPTSELQDPVSMRLKEIPATSPETKDEASVASGSPDTPVGSRSAFAKGASHSQRTIARNVHSSVAAEVRQALPGDFRNELGQEEQPKMSRAEMPKSSVKQNVKDTKTLSAKSGAVGLQANQGVQAASMGSSSAMGSPDALMTGAVQSAGLHPASSVSREVQNGARHMPLHTRPSIQIEPVMMTLNTMIVEGKQRIEIQLHPKEMGKVDIRVDSDSTKHLHVRMIFENPMARQLFDAQLTQLRQSMLDQGFETVSFDFGQQDQGMPQQGESFASSKGQDDEWGAAPSISGKGGTFSDQSTTDSNGETSRLSIRV